MAVVDLESKYVPGWAVGPSANRKLSMRCWEQVRERLTSLGEEFDEKIIHHDLDSVYTSYRWLRAILLGDEMCISYSENGAKGNPWIESLWGRTKAEIGSRITEASFLPALRTVLDERFRYYNRERRHSSIGQIPPREHLVQTLDTLESEPQIAAASWPEIVAQLVQIFGHTSVRQRTGLKPPENRKNTVDCMTYEEIRGP